MRSSMSSEKELKAIVRIAGTDCDGNRKLQYGLCKIRGVSSSFSNAVMKAANLLPEMKVGELTDEDVGKIEKILRNPQDYRIPTWLANRQRDPVSGETNQLIGSEIDMAVRSDIERMKRLGSWKGVRHSLGLKVRGQRTRTTGRTGKTIGVTKKALAAKMREKK